MESKVLFYRPKGDGKTSKTAKKFSRSECIARTLKESPKSLEELIAKSTKLYESQFDGKGENATWESYRIYKILYPALIEMGINIPEILKPEL